MSPLRTLGDVFAAASAIGLQPVWTCGGREVMFVCPQCRQDTTRGRASARMLYGALAAGCRVCDNDADAPSILAILSGAPVNTDELQPWWEPPRLEHGGIDWPNASRHVASLLGGIRGELTDVATLAAEFEAGSVMGFEQRQRWDAIVHGMRCIEQRILRTDDALLSLNALEHVIGGVT